MAEGCVLVLDAGTTSGRCLLFDRNGTVVASAARAWTLSAGRDESPYAREFDPVDLWETIRRLIAECVGRAGRSAQDISAVSATSQRQAVVFLDDAGRELYAGPNTDLRALFEGAAIDDEMRARVYRTTGHLPSFLFAPAKLRWFQLHRPEAYGRIASVLTLADWLLWRLTGVLAAEPTLAGEAGLLDINRRDHCSDMLADLGLLSNDHIPLVESGTVVGGVSGGAAQQTGLRTGMPVAAAGADTQCGLLAMDVTAPGQVGIVAGWSCPVQMVTGAPALSDDPRTWAGCHLYRTAWVAESTAGDAGHSYDWLAGTMGKIGPSGLAEMEHLAAGVPIGSDGVAAFLGQSRMDMGNVGLRAGGLVFPVPLTFDEVGQGHLARACLEATAYAIRANLEQIEQIAGLPCLNLAVGGGMSRSETFLRILTNVLDRELRASNEPNVSALGAFRCAMVALGEYADVQEAGKGSVPRTRRLDPDTAESAEYEELFQQWCRMAAGLEDIPL